MRPPSRWPNSAIAGVPPSPPVASVSTGPPCSCARRWWSTSWPMNSPISRSRTTGRSSGTCSPEYSPTTSSAELSWLGSARRLGSGNRGTLVGARADSSINSVAFLVDSDENQKTRSIQYELSQQDLRRLRQRGHHPVQDDGGLARERTHRF